MKTTTISEGGHMQMRDYSIDLETLGTRYSAAILSIGVQQFDRDSGNLGATFYQEIDMDSAIKSGSITADTLRWWLTQSKGAQRVFSRENKVSLATALDSLSAWLRGQANQPRVWGNGATFDISILEHAYDKGCVGLKEAWHYTNVRDVRTIVDAAHFRHGDIPSVGVHHNALDDATYQANVVSHCWRKIGANKTHVYVNPQDDDL